ncbi:hypothetical protein [Streptomyces sp. NPDC055107]
MFKATILQAGYGLKDGGNSCPAIKAEVEKLQMDRRLTDVDGIV